MDYRQKCTYCGQDLGYPVTKKDRALSAVIQCRNPKCRACWGRELDYKKHIK